MTEQLEPRPQPGRRSGPLLRTMIGDVLRRRRLAQRRTLADVARAARVSMPYLSELERGRKEASSEVLAAICGALEVELADLLVETGHDLAQEQSRRAVVVQLDALRSRRINGRVRGPQAQRSGDVLCLAA